MRPGQKSNRSRGRGNRKGGGNNVNRVYDSAGPEGKVRGTPQQIIEKYLSLARDAQTSGDRVTAENFLQHAEHYQRLLIQATGAQEQSRRDQDDSDDQSDETEAQGGGGHADGQAADTPDEPRRQNNGRRREKAEPNEIGGMAMIDAEETSDDLLVGVDETPRPRRSRRNGADSKPQPAKAEDAQPEV